MAVCRCGGRVTRLEYRGLQLTLDEAQLSALGEFDALVQDQQTYALYGKNAIKRNALEIQTYPNPLGATLHREHVCYRPLPPALCMPPAADRYKADEPGF